MCGILGIYSKFFFDEAIVQKMSKCMLSRGPDDQNIFLNSKDGIILHHSRLSILDLSTNGLQPMHSNNNRWVISYNGEIYNHIEIRNELKIEYPEISWKGSSDTETLINCIELWGLEKTLKKVNGMFAFAVWDKSTKKLFLARDRLGEKPLYYGKIKNDFMFSSDLRAFEKHPFWDGKICRKALNYYKRYGHVPENYSIYEKIYKLKPGSFLIIDDFGRNVSEPNQYWNIASKTIHQSKKNELSFLDAKKEYNNLLKDSVKKRMISDVPLGAFLSGGIDSSLIVAQMQSISTKKIKTFSIGNLDKEYDESKFAKKVAEHLNTEHYEYIISSQDALDIIPKLPEIYDEPFADSSQIPTFLICKKIKNKVTVALSGDGGDELFAGYERSVHGIQIWKYLKYFPHSVRSIISKNLSNKYLRIFGTEKSSKIYKVKNAIKAKNSIEFYDLLRCVWEDTDRKLIDSNLDEKNILDNFLYQDLTTYLVDDILVKLDRASMANSLEARVPFLDHRLVEFSWEIPNHFKISENKGKYISRELLKDFIPKELFERPKKGFTIPLAKWLSGPLKSWAEELLNEDKLKIDGFFDIKEISFYWNELLNGNYTYEQKIWTILAFQSWRQSKSKIC